MLSKSTFWVGRRGSMRAKICSITDFGSILQWLQSQPFPKPPHTSATPFTTVPRTPTRVFTHRYVIFSHIMPAACEVIPPRISIFDSWPPNFGIFGKTSPWLDTWSKEIVFKNRLLYDCAPHQGASNYRRIFIGRNFLDYGHLRATAGICGEIVTLRLPAL